jgi:hypothetical protein
MKTKQEAWAEILKARDAVALAKTENEKAYTQLNLARAELDYEMVRTVEEMKVYMSEQQQQPEDKSKNSAGDSPGSPGAREPLRR